MPVPDPPTPCPQCRGERVAAAPSALYLVPPHHSTWQRLKDRITSQVPLEALVCTTCGHVTFYATTPPHKPDDR